MRRKKDFDCNVLEHVYWALVEKIFVVVYSCCTDSAAVGKPSLVCQVPFVEQAWGQNQFVVAGNLQMDDQKTDMKEHCNFDRNGK